MTAFREPNYPAVFTSNQADIRKFDQDLISVLGEFSTMLKGILDGGISLDDNIDAAVVSFTSNAVADTEDTVAHTLGKVPTYFIVASLDKGAVIYKGPTAFTKNNIYVKSTVASTAVKLILL